MCLVDVNAAAGAFKQGRIQDFEKGWVRVSVKY